MGDKLKKYLSVLQSTQHSSEFKELVAEQLLQFCDFRKSVVAARNFASLVEILVSDPVEGQYKKQHLSIFRGIVKFCRDSEPDVYWGNLLRGLLSEKENESLEHYFELLVKDQAKGAKKYESQGLLITADPKDSRLYLASSHSIKIKDMVEKCENLLGNLLHKEEVKKETKKKGKTAKSTKKTSVSAYVKKQEASDFLLHIPKDVHLNLKEQRKKGEKTEEIKYLGCLLIKNPLLIIYTTLIKKLLNENWYIRNISAILLKELMAIVPISNFANYGACELEVTLIPEGEKLLVLKNTRLIKYDNKCLKAISNDILYRIIAGISNDHFTDYLENTISAPVRESYGSLLQIVLNNEQHESNLWVSALPDITRIITTNSYQWMTRYNMMLLTKYLQLYWIERQTYKKYFPSIKDCLLEGINSEDEVRVIACEIIKNSRDLIANDHKWADYYIELIKAIFANFQKADDIESSSIDMLRLLAILFEEDQSLIKSAAQHIELKVIFVFAFHKLEEVRLMAYKLLFRLINQLYQALSRKTLEKLCPNFFKDLLELVQVSLQGLALESNKEILKTISKGFFHIVGMCGKEALIHWYTGKKLFIKNLLLANQIEDFSEFLFFMTEEYASSHSYYSFLGKPVTSSEISYAFYSKAYYMTKALAALSNQSIKIEDDIVNTFIHSTTLMNKNMEVQCYLSYWLSKKKIGSWNTQAYKMLEGGNFIGLFSRFFSNEERQRYGLILRDFISLFPEQGELNVFLRIDIENDTTTHLEQYYNTLQEMYKSRKETGERLNALARLFLEISRIHDWCSGESIKFKALCSAICINQGVIEKKIPEKLNPIIKPILEVMQKNDNIFLHTIVSRELASLQFVNKTLIAVNEKITNLAIRNYIEMGCEITQYLKRYMKLFMDQAFIANNRALDKNSVTSISEYLSSDSHSALKEVFLLSELKLIHQLLLFCDSIQHHDYIASIFQLILQFIKEFGAKGGTEIEKNQSFSEPTEKMLKTLLLLCIKLLGEELYDSFTISFIKIIQDHNGLGLQVFSLFILEIPKNYMAYLPYFIMSIIRNFCIVSVSAVCYQLFSNILKILPLNNISLFEEIPKLSFASKTIEEDSAEAVEFLKSFLVSEQKYDYKLSIKYNGQLRSYQRDGIAWMAFMHKYNINCALCDDMGLGKTIQALTLIANEIHCMKGKKALPSLIVCPSTLTKNWYYEIPKFFDKETLDGVIYQGPKDFISKLASSYQIIITSYDRVRSEIEVLKKIPFFFVVLDEAHIVKNSKAKITQAVKQLQAERKLILSGTPLHNNVTEIWSLFDFLNPGFLGTEPQFEQTYTKHLMANLKKINEKIEETQDFGNALESLKQRISPFILRRTKQEVLKDLPPKIIQDYNCKPSPLQESILNELNQKHPLDAKPAHGEGELMLQRIQWHLYLCNHPKFLFEKSILSKTFASKLQVEFDLPANTSEIEYSHSGKLLSLKQLLQECGILHEPTDTTLKDESSSLLHELASSGSAPHRALIFCQKISMLDIIEEDFLKHLPSIKYLRLDSRVEAENRVDIARQFNVDASYHLMLLTTKVGGYGLTLTGADTVIFYDHDWNPMNDLQAMDRTHRIGQTRTVNVYRLIMLDTIEEKVLNLQKFKQNLSKCLIENEKTTSDKLNLQEMFESFAEKADSADSRKKKASPKTSYLDEIAHKWAESDIAKSDDLEQFPLFLQIQSNQILKFLLSHFFKNDGLVCKYNDILL